MLTIVRKANGRRVDGLVLAANADTMRVVFHEGNETTELSRIGPYWVTDRGELVEIEMVIPVSGTSSANGWSKSLSAVA